MSVQCKNEVSNWLRERIQNYRKKKMQEKTKSPMRNQNWNLFLPIDTEFKCTIYDLHNMRNLNWNNGIKSGPTLMKCGTQWEQTQDHCERTFFQHRAAGSVPGECLGECGSRSMLQWSWTRTRNKRCTQAMWADLEDKTPWELELSDQTL